MIYTHMLIEHDRPAQIITVPENYKHQFDARKGDVINVIMEPTGDIKERCFNMGGDAELIYNSYTMIWTCEKVDF
jgi:hypothetical protein